MCGIAGIMMRDGHDVAAAKLDTLAAALAHRGPDGPGIYRQGPVGLLNTRLAIVDIDHGQQPFVSPDGVALVANGEIYNDKMLRSEFADRTFRSGSDCEPPLHLYLRHGLDFAQHLRGMYAIALFDPAQGRLILSRDPFGIKPLYYTVAPGWIAFASEPQALIAADLAGNALNLQARAELMQLQFTTGADTIFKDIKRVLPGETLTVSLTGQVSSRRIREHLSLAPRSDYATPELAARSFDILLEETTSAHLRADVPSGLFLSGGIDSSALMGVMARLSSQPIVAMTAAFPGAGCKDESEKARRVAQSCHADHQIVDVTAEDFWQHAPALAAAMDDPTADASALPLFMLARAARQRDLKVVLSGEGADELFGGYRRYRQALWFFGLWRNKTRTRGVFRMGQGPACLNAWRLGLDLAERAEARLSVSAIQTLQAVDCAEWLPNDLLLKLDRCLMAHGVEGRTPFLDPILSPFAYGLPPGLKVRGQMGKWLLRDWVARNVPAADAWSKKQGFVPPVGMWIDAHKERLLPLLIDHPGLADMNMQPAIREIFAAPIRYPQAAWSLVFYALWHSHHVLGISGAGAIDEVLDQTRRAA